MHELANFFYEVGSLKRQPRSGWKRIGISAPESVADHTVRTAIIAFVLAGMEGLDQNEAAVTALFHELPETRLGDLDKIQQRYLNKDEAEVVVLNEQLASLPPELAARIKKLIGTFEEGAKRTPVQEVVRDADYLEVILQAKEYLLQGYIGAQNWIDNTMNKGCLKSENAKKLAAEIVVSDPREWYERLKKIER